MEVRKSSKSGLFEAPLSVLHALRPTGWGQGSPDHRLEYTWGAQVPLASSLTLAVDILNYYAFFLFFYLKETWGPRKD